MNMYRLNEVALNNFKFNFEFDHKDRQLIPIPIDSDLSEVSLEWALLKLYDPTAPSINLNDLNKFTLYISPENLFLALRLVDSHHVRINFKLDRDAWYVDNGEKIIYSEGA